MIDSYAAQQREKENLLKQQQANQAQVLQNQVNKTISQLENTKKQYGQTYNDNATQAYLQKIRAQRDLPQQLAAQGISGELSESGNIALNSSYGNQLSGYKRDYDNQLSGVDQNIYNARQDYDSAVANLNNTYLGQIAENKSYFDNLISQQKAAQLQAQEQARQAAAAQATAIERQRQAELEAKKKKLGFHINNLSNLHDANSMISYLNSYENSLRSGSLTQEDAKWLANYFGIGENQYKSAIANRVSNQRPDYMTPAEWEMYLTDGKKR